MITDQESMLERTHRRRILRIVSTVLVATCVHGFAQTPTHDQDAATPGRSNIKFQAKGTALKACRDLRRGGNYYLAQDVSSSGVCFAIDADGIKLNLNGHTVTYDTGGASNAPAIEGHDCWSKTNPPLAGPCGGAHGDAEIYNGTIVQASGDSAFSSVFMFGQGSFGSAPYIHDITATFQNVGAQFYSSAYLPPGARIDHNTIYDNVTRINRPGQGDQSARSHFQGQAIEISQNRNNRGRGDSIQANKIVGSPQGGVYSDNQHTVVSGNDITMNGRYANDFCDAMAADYQVAIANNCHPKSGRGFHVNANYNIVSNNTISVIERKQNMEYGTNGQPGCEIGGAYGVQVEFDSSFLRAPPVGVKVTGNTITATAEDCKAIGLRVTGMTPAGSAVFAGNTIVTKNTGGAGKDFGISLDDSDHGTTFIGNTFRDDYAYADGEWDGYRDTVGQNTWLGKPSYSFVAIDGGCDPSQNSSDALCPSSFTFVDHLSSPVSCGPFSEATVTVGGKVIVCKAQQ